MERTGFQRGRNDQVERMKAVAVYGVVPLFTFARVGERIQENLTFELTEIGRFYLEVVRSRLFSIQR